MPKLIKEEPEERVFNFSELRVDGENNKPQIVGYAAVFDKPSKDLGGFREYVRAGCFTKTIQESDIRALFNHDANCVLGRNKAGTLKLEEDPVGLKMIIDPPDTNWARDLMTSIKRGDIDQCSFSFKTIKDSWNQDTTGKNVTRDLLECRLFDVSVVTNPAYPQTSASVRTKLESLMKPAEPEKILHSVDEPPKNGHSSEDELRKIHLKQVFENVDVEV
jgi:HK97 family phage prohead protease